MFGEKFCGQVYINSLIQLNRKKSKIFITTSTLKYLKVFLLMKLTQEE